MALSRSRHPRLTAWLGHKTLQHGTGGKASKKERPSTEHKKASTMKFVLPDTRCNGYKKRRSSFLKELY
jgi:hypothetical protein